MRRTGKINILGVLLTAGVVYGGWTGLVWWKMHWNNLAAQDVVKRASFEWRDLNKPAAEALLKRELTGLGFEWSQMCKADGEYGCCRFYEQANERHLDCWWWDVWTLPVVGKETWVLYESHKVLSSDNQVYDGNDL